MHLFSFLRTFFIDTVIKSSQFKCYIPIEKENHVQAEIMEFCCQLPSCLFKFILNPFSTGTGWTLYKVYGGFRISY